MDQLSLSGPVVFPTSGMRKHPLPETLAEAEKLAASIERAVRIETGGGVRNLHVEVSRTRVLLDGRCTTFYTKQKAQHAAMVFSGGRELTNRIEVL
ncbi:MAG: BON domain-containing protein [Thermoguttaceae bacterium]|jgi:osmotically-inducible protein OsmY|nr:BON domain-containing protein [Thermoguttaceae bacterium]